jgi:hypothetical protein
MENVIAVGPMQIGSIESLMAADLFDVLAKIKPHVSLE